MIESRCAYTEELDNIPVFVEEILGQLAKQAPLAAHSAGIVTCYPEFIENGAVKALSEALPFDIIGCTTAGSAACAGLGEIGLSLLVLTSDTVSFSAGFSPDLDASYAARIEKSYKIARATLDKEPALLLAFTPMLQDITGEAIVEVLNALDPALPIFGAQAVEYIDITNFTHSQTIYNGQAQRNALAFLLLAGDVHPTFFSAFFSDVHTQKQKALITKSAGNTVLEVNGVPFLEYLEKIGISGLREGTSLAFPFLVDYKDGTKPVPRALYAVTPAGEMVFSVKMPEGATISVVDIDYAGVLQSAQRLLDAVSVRKPHCTLLFSCLIRYISLGADTLAEMELVKSRSNGAFCYQFAYTGGEICPVYTERGQLVNRFHNCTLAACLL